MGRFKTEKYMNSKEIVHSGQFDSMPVVVDSESVEVENGKKVAKAGTLVKGKTKSIFENRQEVIIKANDQTAEGVLLYDVDVTDGPREGSLLFRGNVALKNLPEKPSAEAVKALALIKFIAE